MQVGRPMPLQLPIGGTARCSLYIDSGGSPATKSKATAAAPDVASQGTNVTYQLIFNDPGTSVQDVGVLAVDRRTKGEFFQTSAHVWVNQDKVIFVVPKSEVRSGKAVRVGAFAVARAAQGDASLVAQEIVPAI